MKNIFEYLQTEEGFINEDVFESFSHWMFEGGDPTNALSRIFLYWCVLYIIPGAADKKLENSDFYSFFEGYDRTDFDAFLNYISQDSSISELIAQTLKSDPLTGYSSDYRTTYWYFIGIIKEHVDNNNLFPEEPEESSNILSFDQKRKKSPESAQDKNQLSEADMKKVSNIFRLILVALVVLFLFFNFIK